MKHYLESIENVYAAVSSGPRGLTSKEAGQRLRAEGKNKLTEPPKDSVLKRFFKQMADPMIIILLVSAVISGVTAAYQSESFADVFIILFVVCVNAVLGVVQESKAEKAIDALKEMTGEVCKVQRDGTMQNVKSEELVRGDILLLEAGDAIPADARIIESISLKMEEAALTGESVPTEKTTEPLRLGTARDITLGDRKNMVYTGSTVAYGRGKAVVVATGMQTEIGKIAQAISLAKEERTPLQIRLAQLSKMLTILVLGICALIFGVDLIRKSGDLNARSVINMFMIAVSLAVAAIPEGLVAVVTIVLSIGVTKMSRRHAIIRRLTAVETLGCTQVICSDKTGTLTQNKMTVVEHYGPDEELLAKAMALASDAELRRDNVAVGEPTECALLNYANTLSLPKYELIKEYPLVGEAPFDSLRKRMSTVHAHGAGFIQFSKGAPDEILKLCTKCLTKEGVVSMTEGQKAEISAETTGMANKALRVLACAYREYAAAPADFRSENLERELVFIGLTGMIDPVRPEVLDAIQKCRLAGIRPVMITGDHKNTAVAIAKELDILQDDAGVITGVELDEMSEEALRENIAQYSVYARVQPDHKVRIVNAWKATGAVTAMTGDGVNDAASIKSADIGVGMGITGTDVTKNVADMVLADDNFATIIAAVEEGRKIYDNIKKCIQFLLASNLSEVMSIFIATLFGFTILEPVHILWINLITDSSPALALGMEKEENDLMLRAPRSPQAGIFSGGVGVDVVYQGILVTILTLAAYFIGHYMENGVWEVVNSPDGMTMAFITMSMAEIFHSFNMRSQRHSVLKMRYHNLYLYGAMLASLVLTIGVIYIPTFSVLFGFEEISLGEYAVALGLALLVFPIVEFVKALQRKFTKKTR